MAYADIIAREADLLPLDKQAEVLDFIEFLKARQIKLQDTVAPKTAKEIESFFRSFTVDTKGFKFDRDEANAR